MGNTVCCDKAPFTMSDIAQTRDSFSARRVVAEGLVPNIAGFAGYAHNLKVFAVGEPTTGFPTRESTKPVPVNLSSMAVVDPTLAYVVLDIKRGAPATAAGAAEQVAPRWALDSFAALTPRGLGCTFAFDFGNLLLRTPPTQERFFFSIFVFKGRLASATTGAAATMVGMNLERLVMCDAELLARLFYNYNVARPSEAGLVSSVGVIDFSDPRVDRSAALRDTDFAAVVMKHALLRSLANQLEAEKTAAAGTPARRELLDRSAQKQLQQSPAVPLSMSPAGNGGRHVDPVPVPVIQLTTRDGDPPTRTRSSAPSDTTAAATPAPPSPIAGIPKMGLPAGWNRPLPAMPPLAAAAADTVAADGDVDPDNEVEVTRDKKDRLKKFEPLVTQVLPYLFVGGETAAKDLAQLQQCGITHIVNAAAVIVPSFYPSSFAYTNLFLCDTPDEPIDALFALVVSIVEEAVAQGGKVFIHCVQGVSRSCSLVIAYVMWRNGLSYDAAYRLVRAQRQICSPNSGFMVHLMGFQKQLVAGHKGVSYLWRYQPYTKSNPTPMVFQAVPLVAGGGVVLDPATCYGCVAHRDGGIDVYFATGSAIHSNAVVASAAAQFEQHVRCSFFVGPTGVKSRTHRGDEIVVQPATAHRRRLARLSHEDLALVLAEALGGQDPPLTVAVTTGPDPAFRDMLGAAGSLAGVQAAEQQQTAAVVPAAAAPSPPPRVPPLAALRRPAEANAEANAVSAASASPAQPAAPPPLEGSVASVAQSDLSFHDDDSEPEDGQDSVLVFQFPFRRAEDRCEIIGIDDLNTDTAYAIILRGYRPSNRPHLVYWWVGDDFTKSDEELAAAYDANLLATDLRITSRTMLRDVPPVQCLEGAEPDELCLAFA